MITKINVDGFKSLLDFEITFQKGLNVIIGPNGAGKTNICQSLILLSSLPSNEIKETLNFFGGASSVFNKKSTKRRTISIKAEGEVEAKYPTKESYEEFKLTYLYAVEIRLQANNIIKINEDLLISRLNKENIYIPVINVSHRGDILKYKILNKSLVGDFKISEDNISIRMEYGDNLWSLMPKISYVCHIVGRDIYRIKSINIDPHIARAACDIVDPDRMLSNGRYLANALYCLSKQKGRIDEINTILADSLECECQIKPEFSQLSLKRHFALIKCNGDKFSSSSLSDGTIKLIGLLVGIVNQEKYSMIIEEPENYLHPRVDRLLVDYLRETFDNGSCILTSHSETILNLISPNEIIICKLDNGITKCKRINDTKQVIDSIIESGFGCGYHYVAGNFSNL